MTDTTITPPVVQLNPSVLIKSYHAHVYFDEETAQQAKSLCAAAGEAFDVTIGRMHPGPVGPHPMGSCQIGCSVRVFADLLPWLALNRNGLVIFAHPETGDHLADHRDHAIWMGGFLPLDLSLFN